MRESAWGGAKEAGKGGEIEETNRRRGGSETEEVKGEIKSEVRSRNGLLRRLGLVGGKSMQ